MRRNNHHWKFYDQIPLVPPPLTVHKILLNSVHSQNNGIITWNDSQTMVWKSGARREPCSAPVSTLLLILAPAPSFQYQVLLTCNSTPWIPLQIYRNLSAQLSSCCSVIRYVYIYTLRPVTWCDRTVHSSWIPLDHVTSCHVVWRHVTWAIDPVGAGESSLRDLRVLGFVNWFSGCISTDISFRYVGVLNSKFMLAGVL